MPSIRNHSATLIVFAVLAIAPAVALLFGEPYYMTFLSRVMVFGLAAVGLNLVVGFGGMASLGHAAFIGIGAYTVGLLMKNGITDGFAHFTLVLLLGGLGAAAIGAVCLRTSGLSFIMLSLASAQMLFFVGSGLKQYGGDDGFSFRGRSDFLGLSLDRDMALYYFIFAWLLAATLVAHRLVASRFGVALQGIKSNEVRARSIGLDPYRYKLAAFVISGMICAVAGGLLANLSQFVSPSYMHWSRSAELLLMVLLGGMSTVLGPLAGAAVFLILEELLSQATPHWQAPMGLILVVVVLFARGGVSSLLSRAAALWPGGRDDPLPADAPAASAARRARATP